MTKILCKNKKCVTEDMYWEDDLEDTKKFFKYCPACGSKKLEITDDEDF